MLFGKFYEKLTKEDKDKKWNKITDEAKSLGAKGDNQKKTGRGSGDDTHVTEMDTIVYDIIGNDSPVLDGLLIPRSSRSNFSEAVVPVVSNKPIDDVRGEEESISSVSNSKLTRTVGSKGLKRFRLRETNNEEQQLKIRKLK
ncbi:hypothetical protein ILUMI_13582 [Ignelater luminosus]|uniref:Uncharacterized protein n=1 Tax=Ignelater luminosus TaxID=2038154 RepID=A0A8K0G5N9_IGNLU|nr:hypothetical protein ILUMI_13582 [Ignelater luminosus]